MLFTPVSAGRLTLHVHQVNSEPVSDLHLNVSHLHTGTAQGKAPTLIQPRH